MVNTEIGDGPVEKSERETEVEIALFTIPGGVALPHAVVPLHIFEPRYRRLVHDCIRDGRRMAIAHARRQTAPSHAPANAPIEVALASNQETYESHAIFSAGVPEIIETLPDGRLVIRIPMDGRFETLEELRQIPYKVVRCEPFRDRETSESRAEADVLRHRLDRVFLELPGPNVEALRLIIEGEAWRGYSNERYSYGIFELVGFEPDVLQEVLEMRTAADRIRFVIEALE